MAFLERSADLAELRESLLRALEQGGSVVFLGGAAGVGKSTLVREFCATVEGTARVLLGGCEPLATPRPLGPFLDMLDDLGGDVERAILDGTPRSSLFRSVLRGLADGGRPTLMVIEDAHWADEATLDLVRFLIRRVPSIPALLLVTYRDDEVGSTHPFRTMLGDVATASWASRMTLGPLSLDAVRRLAHGSEVDAVSLHRLTGGNPFFVTEVLAAGGDLIPDTVRDAVLARATRLPRIARAVLDIAAVLGPRCEPRFIVGLSPDSMDAVLEAIDTCVDTGVLIFDDDLLRFRHELAREAVYGALSPPRRAMLHARALQVLEAELTSSSDPGRLAHHAEGAGIDDATLRFSLEAARAAAALSAHREALAQYRRALRFAGGLETAARAELLEEASYEAYLAGELTPGIDMLQRGLALRREMGDRLAVGRGLIHLSRLLGTCGDLTAGDTAILDATRILEELGQTSELALAYSAVSQLHMLAGRNRDAIAWGERAIRMARELESAEPLLHAMNNVGRARLRLNDPTGREHLLQSLALARDHGYEDHVARAYINLVSDDVDALNLVSAETRLDEALAYCVEHDLDQNRMFLAAQKSLLAFFRGEWGHALSLAEDVLRSRTSRVSEVLARIVIARVHVRTGASDPWLLLSQAAELAQRAGQMQRIVLVQTARIEAGWLDGDLEGAMREARNGLEAALRDETVAYIGHFAFWLSLIGGPGMLPPGLPILPAPFDHAPADDPLGASEAYAQRGCPYEAALCLVASDDVALVQRALGELELLGATPAAAVASRRLKELGGRPTRRGPRAATRANPGLLTGREIEVLQLVADGLRNSDIAERLYISAHTAGHHVSSILAKLDARSRSEAVAKGAGLGIVHRAANGEIPHENSEVPPAM